MNTINVNPRRAPRRNARTTKKKKNQPKVASGTNGQPSTIVRFDNKKTNPPAKTQAGKANCCSLVNPWDSKACMKWPDRGGGNTFTATLKSIFPITTDANGCYAGMFTTIPSQTYYVGTVTSGDVSTWSSNTATKYTAWAASAKAMRPVSGGVRYFTTTADATSTGYIIMSRQSASSSAPLTGVTVASANSNKATTRAVRDADIRTTFKMTSDTNSFISADATAIGFWDSILLTAQSTLNTTIGYAEVTVNYECTPKENDIAEFFASPTPLANPKLQETVANSQNYLQDFVDSKLFNAAVDKAVTSALAYGRSMYRGDY